VCGGVQTGTTPVSIHCAMKIMLTIWKEMKEEKRNQLPMKGMNEGTCSDNV